MKVLSLSNFDIGSLENSQSPVIAGICAGGKSDAISPAISLSVSLSCSVGVESR